MPNEEEIVEQQKLLRAHRQTLSHYLYQEAVLGRAYVPPGVTHGIREARDHIRQIKKLLREWGIQIEDHPNDDEEDKNASFSANDSNPSIRQSEFTRKRESSLRARANAVFNAYLVRIKVLNAKLKIPIVNALIELNVIELTKLEYFKKMFLRAGIPDPQPLLTTTTSPEGVVYFALPENTLIVENWGYVVSATAPGFGVKHKILNYPKLKMASSLVAVREAAIILASDEVEGRKPDEIVILRLMPSDAE